MFSDPESNPKTGGTIRRRMRLRRRRKLPTVRLGGAAGTKQPQEEEPLNTTKNLRVPLRKVKYFFNTVVKEFVEAGGNTNSLQQKIMTESSFTVPIKGVAVSGFLSVSGAGAAKLSW